MRFPPSLLDEIRARLPVSQVVARKVALKRAGREFKGLSPFKQERTPSFTVNDQKGFYHCFASGEHGDIFAFVVKTEGLSFPEAVEQLAQEAGVPMPEAGPRDVQAEDARARLYALVAAAAAYFEAQLAAPGGQEARRYLDKRGLSRDAIARFGLGYAPNSKSALKEQLGKARYSTAEMIASGMLIAGDDIPVPYDRFRHRIMFPIADAKGRVIAFGGRALDPDAPAKYLNSPETPLFHKGHVLFNAHRARGPAHDKSQVIVVEGYMDVIALSEAGFPQTVAPLGTALTEDQLKLLWRMAPEPTLCFDGDAAGRRAAFRAVETALPHLRPGSSVGFAFLPEGLDPDDLIRARGKAAFDTVLIDARPLVDVLWNRELAARPVDTPERQAAFEHRLQQLILGISDSRVRALYQREAKDRIWRLWRDARRTKAPQRQRPSPENIRDGALLLAVVAHPWLLDEFIDEIIRFEFSTEAYSQLFSQILRIHSDSPHIDSADLAAKLRGSTVATLFEHLHTNSGHKGVAFVRPDAKADLVRRQFSTFLDGARLRTLRAERDRLKDLIEPDPAEALLNRLAGLRQEIEVIEKRMNSQGDGEVAERDFDQFAASILAALDNGKAA